LEAPGAIPDLAVLPESVFPVPINDLPVQAVQTLVDYVTDTQATLLFGAFIEEPRAHFYNSVIALTPDRPVQDYRKRHLVPFGEFIPWGFQAFVDRMRIPIADQQRGAAYQAPITVKDQRIALNICYEDLFGAEIIQAWHQNEQTPHLLLNVSNLAWFDDSIALDQHLQISRMRALETARPMLRATNTGATALIDERGQVRARLPYIDANHLDVTVQGQSGLTPYVRWGNGPALTLALGLLAITWARMRRQANRQHTP
nr:apolipoprotein N-acyltransferase [Burkholderiaceae bacterium]